jgi:hypothetical protein
METASKNVPSLDETVRRCDGDTRTGGVDGYHVCASVASSKQASSKQHALQTDLLPM